MAEHTGPGQSHSPAALRNHGHTGTVTHSTEPQLPSLSSGEDDASLAGLCGD